MLPDHTPYYNPTLNYNPVSHNNPALLLFQVGGAKNKGVSQMFFIN